MLYTLQTIAEAVGDWYYSRRVTKEIDCPYPCDSSCHNLIPESTVDQVKPSSVLICLALLLHLMMTGSYRKWSSQAFAGELIEWRAGIAG